jgi:hypothetical protein
MIPHSIVTAFLLVITGSTAAFADEVIQMTPPEYKAFSDVAREFGSIKSFESHKNTTSAEMTSDGFIYFVHIENKNGAPCEDNCTIILKACTSKVKTPDYDDFSEWSNNYYSYIVRVKEESGACLVLNAPSYKQPLTADKLQSVFRTWLQEVDKFKHKFQIE